MKVDLLYVDYFPITAAICQLLTQNCPFIVTFSVVEHLQDKLIYFLVLLVS